MDQEEQIISFWKVADSTGVYDIEIYENTAMCSCGNDNCEHIQMLLLCKDSAAA